MESILLRRSGNLLEVSLNGDAALPEDVRRLLEPQLRYDKLKFNYGFDRYNPVTNRWDKRVEVQEKQCFRYDRFGRLITSFGFIYRLHKVLSDGGITVAISSYDNKELELSRPDRYATDTSIVEHHFAYRQRQEEALSSILTKPCGVIHAVTGFGKLVLIAMACLAFPKATIHVITRRATLVNKINQYLTRYIPNVGQVGAGRRTVGSRVTVFTCDSLHHSKFDADILLVDEAHEALADEASKYIAQYQHSRNYGLTASASGRLDGTDIRMEAIFGRTIFYLSYQEAVELGLVVPIRVEWTDVLLTDNPCEGLDDIPKKRAAIWSNCKRNNIIAAKALSFDSQEQVLILTETIEHAVNLKKHLPDYALVYDQMDDKRFKAFKKGGLIPTDEPEMTPARKEQMRIDFETGKLRKAIATKMWSVGIDPVELTALIRADAGASEISDIQAPGRVSRIHSLSGKDVGIVCDFRDQFDTSYSRRASSRAAHYHSMGWEQSDV